MSYARNPLVSWLCNHAYGQGGTVAIPSSDPAAFQAPKGEFPAGIDDVIAYLERRYRNWKPSDHEIDWCFLVGGPGNGKSEALRSLASRVAVTLPPRMTGQPVLRVVPETWPQAATPLSSGLEIAFINDASIPRAALVPTAGLPGSLFHDIHDGLGRVLNNNTPVALFGNVNRGILVEEAGRLDPAHALLATPAGALSADLIRWLARPPIEKSASSTASPPTIATTVAVDSLSPHYGQCVITLPSAARVTVHAIFLDVLSLLEPRPGSGGPVVDFQQAPPTVAPYHTLGSLRSMEVTRDQTTAGRFLKELTKSERWQDTGCRSPDGGLCEAYATCPFAQNALWLQDDALRHRFLDSMRGAEVAAARRFTYRDLLGHVSLAVLGQPEQSWLEQLHPCDWTRDHHAKITSSTHTTGKKESAVSLLCHRVYGNLFGNPSSDGRQFSEKELKDDTIFGAVKARRQVRGESPRVQAFERAFQEIDPARDTDTWKGIRSRVLDAIEALDVQSPALAVTQWSEIAPNAHCQLETLLDNALREEIATELERGSRVAGNRVRALRRWRSMLMLRQVGLALGHIAFGHAIQAWLAEQENALRLGQRMSLGDGIHNLVIPPGRGGHVYFAPLRPRTYCIGDLPADTLLVSVATTDLVLSIVSQGDTLLAEVLMSRQRERTQTVLATLVIDLAVAREAILHRNGDSRSFTEIGYTAFARIERARASLISRERMRALPAHFTDHTEQLYKVSPNPGGPVPLRVQKV